MKGVPFYQTAGCHIPNDSTLSVSLAPGSVSFVLLVFTLNRNDSIVVVNLILSGCGMIRNHFINTTAKAFVGGSHAKENIGQNLRFLTPKDVVQ